MSHPYYGFPYRRYPSYGYPYPSYPAHHLPYRAIVDSQVSNIQQSIFNTGIQNGVSQVANSYNIGPMDRAPSGFYGW